MSVVLRLVLLAIGLSFAACSREPPADTTQTPAPASEPSPPSFVDTVWRVSASSTVAPGTLYVFLSEGTLVIASRGNKPSFGTWTNEDGRLTMVEEGIPYKVDVLSLTEREFRIRSHNPGEPVEITLARAH